MDIFQILVLIMAAIVIALLTVIAVRARVQVISPTYLGDPKPPVLDTLPLSSGVPIKPGSSAQITARPQRAAFRPTRIIIDNASDWVVNDIKIGNSSQFSQDGDVPGILFAFDAPATLTAFDTVYTGGDFKFIATYVGKDPEGAALNACALGIAVMPVEEPNRKRYQVDGDSKVVDTWRKTEKTGASA